MNSMSFVLVLLVLTLVVAWCSLSLGVVAAELVLPLVVAWSTLVLVCSLSFNILSKIDVVIISKQLSWLSNPELQTVQLEESEQTSQFCEH